MYFVRILTLAVLLIGSLALVSESKADCGCHGRGPARTAARGAVKGSIKLGRFVARRIKHRVTHPFFGLFRRHR